MDMSDLFKRHLAKLHKANNLIKTIQDRKEHLINERKSKRETLTNARRNIDINMSPYSTPVTAQAIEKKVNKPTGKKESEKKSTAEVVSKRLELLAKWKAEKAKQKQLEMAKKKPIFKVCHVSTSTSLCVNLENVNKVPSTVKKSQFAPRNHKFRPPEGIKPLSFNYSKSKTLENPWKISKSPKSIRTSKPELVKQKTPREDHKVSRSQANQKQPIKEKEDLKKQIIKTVSAKPSVASISENRQTPVAGTSQKKTDINKIVNKSSKSYIKELKKTVTSPSKKKTPLLKNTLTSPSNKKNTVGSPSKKNTPQVTSTVTSTSKKKTPQIKSTVTSNSKKKTPQLKNSVTSSSKKKIPQSKNIVTSPSKKKTPQNVNKLSSTPNNEIEESPINGIEESPNKKSEEVAKSSVSTPVYVSPFVTISRGKRSAREEFKIRHSYGKEVLKQPSSEKLDFLNSYTSSQAGADYFMVKLNSEIDRINKMCEEWENYLQEPHLSDEAVSSIGVTIGQSKLLLSKKFEQFRGLIIQCKTKQYEEKDITCGDLHGFWDMVYMQVEDLDRRFAHLEKLKQNNWEELLPEKKAPVKKTKARTKKATGTSRLKDIIRAAREKKNAGKDTILESEKNGGYSEVQSPVKEKPSTSNADSTRKNLRVSLLAIDNRKRASSSPGLTLMKISQSIKQGNGLTPAKSILKSESCKSTGKKSVVFKENLSPIKLRRTVLFSEGEKEILRRSDACSEEEKENTPIGLRRSSRLAK